MPSIDEVRLRHILDAARQASTFIKERSRGDLDRDPTLSLARVRLLEMIGEAARGISKPVRDANAQVSWNKIAGIRDRLIHGYFDVNLDVVWQTVAEDLPTLIAQVEKVLGSLG